MSRQTGNHGEALAKAFLEEAGYWILALNAHQRLGEIDLIAVDPETDELVFAEVKARNKSLGFPEEAVDRRKLKKLEQAALIWLDRHQEDRAWRIDVLAVQLGNPPKIEHFKSVTQES